MNARSAAELPARRPGVFGALAAALPDLTPRRREAERERPDLRVVEAEPRRLPRWKIGGVAGLILFLALFAVAGAQTFIIQGQRHLDEVNARIATEQTDAEALRMQLAELQSPERITAAAADQLGMIPAPTPVYIVPRADDDARAGEEPPVAPSTTMASRASSAATKATGSSTKTTTGTSTTATTPATSASTTGSSGTGK